MRTDFAQGAHIRGGDWDVYWAIQWYNGSTWSSLSPILEVELVLEQYGGYGHIVVEDSGQGFSTFDDEFRPVRPRWGYNSDASDWPNYYIESWYHAGAPGQSVFVLELITAFEILAASKEYRGSKYGTGMYVYNTVDHFNAGSEMTIEEIIDDLCTEAGVTLGVESRDSLINSITPYYFTIERGESRLDSIFRLLKRTECELVLNNESDGTAPEVHIVDLPRSQAGTPHFKRAPSASYEYFLYGHRKGDGMYSPTKVEVLAKQAQLPVDNKSGTFTDGEKINNTTSGAFAWVVDDAGSNLIIYSLDEEHGWSDGDSIQGASSGRTATVNNSDAPNGGAVNYVNTSGSYDASEPLTSEWVELLPAMSQQYTSTQCTAMATDIVQRAQRRAKKGQLKVSPVPHLEIWDRVSATDDWTGEDLSLGTIGRIELQYSNPRNSREPLVFEMYIGLGDYRGVSRPSAFVGGFIPAGGMIPSVADSLALRPNYMVNEHIMRQSLQCYEVDVRVYPNGDDEVYWDAGHVYFMSGDNEAIDARAVGSALTLSEDVEYLYGTEGSSTLQLTDNPFTPVRPGNFLIATCFKSDDADQDAVIWPFKGKEPVINGALISANAIAADHIQAGVITVSHFGSLPGDNVLENPRLENVGDTAYDVPGWVLSSGAGSGGNGDAQRYAGGAYSRTTNQTGMRFRSDTVSDIEWSTVSTTYHADEGDIWTAEGWFRAESAGQDDPVAIAVSFRDRNGSSVTGGEATSDYLSATTTYTRRLVSHKAPADTVYVRLEVKIQDDPTYEGHWHGTDFKLYRSSRDVVQGTPGAASIVIGTDDTEGLGIFGYDSTPDLQFYITADDGKGYFAGGDAFLDESGLVLGGDNGGAAYFRMGGSNVGTLGPIDLTPDTLRLANANGCDILINAKSGSGADITIEADAVVDIEGGTIVGESTSSYVDFTGYTDVNLNADGTGGGGDLDCRCADDFTILAGQTSASGFVADAGYAVIYARDGDITIETMADGTDVNITGEQHVYINATDQDVRVDAGDDVIIDAGDDIFLNATDDIELDPGGLLTWNHGHIYPGTIVGGKVDGSYDLGDSDARWDEVYTQSLQEIPDYLYLDDKDDIAAIHAIKGSGVIDSRTGLELIDDDTIPEWLLSRDKEGKELIHSSEGKPYLANKTIHSLLMGAIRQLDNKVEELKRRLNP